MRRDKCLVLCIFKRKVDPKEKKIQHLRTHQHQLKIWIKIRQTEKLNLEFFQSCVFETEGVHGGSVNASGALGWTQKTIRVSSLLSLTKGCICVFMVDGSFFFSNCYKQQVYFMSFYKCPTNIFFFVYFWGFQLAAAASRFQNLKICQ